MQIDWRMMTGRIEKISDRKARLVGAAARVVRPVLAALIIGVLSGYVSAAELVVNGGFEAGDFSGGWVDGAGNVMGPLNPSWADHAVLLEMPYSGNYSALLGFKYTEPQQHRYGFMYYDVAIPSDISSAMLSFRFRHMGYDGEGRDPFNVEIRDTGGGTLATILSHTFPERTGTFKETGWVSFTHDMSAYAGQTVRVYFEQLNDIDNRWETWVYVDDVSLEAAGWVDLVVDGDGNDLFGVPGSGAGGTSAQSTEANESLSYFVDIENEGPVDDSYDLSLSLPAGWTAVLRYGGIDYAFPWTTPVIAAESTIQAEVIITVPAGEPLGMYTSILDAVSTTPGDRYDSVSLLTNVVPAPYQPDLAVDGDGIGSIDQDGAEGGYSTQTTTPSTAVDFEIELLNSGTENDSFSISWASETPLSAVVIDGATTHAAPFTSAVIPPGASLYYTLRVTVPAGVLGGDYSTELFARSVGDILESDGITAMTSVLAPAVDMLICGSGDGIVDPTGSGLGGSCTAIGVPGEIVYFPIAIRNEGTVPDSFQLTWTRPRSGWTAVITDGVDTYPLPWTTPVFAPGEERTYFLVVAIPANADYTTYISLLDAVSTTDGAASESITASVTVGSVNEIDLWIDGNGDDIYGLIGTGLGGFSSAAGSPGDTLFFTITLENESGTDLFDLYWSAPSGWEVLIGDSTSSMRGIMAGTYILEVRVPPTAVEGTFQIILDGQKADKPYLVDSVNGTIVITRSYIVDAVIDGDGDGVYGTAGLGDGGFSAGTATPGASVTFFLELQNEGSEPESYTVTWNSIAGWTAALDGNASPYTTVVIPAGGSAAYSFDVDVPFSALPGDYDYTIDVVSTVDPINTESVTAGVTVVPVSPAYIAVAVFEDADHDGSYDPGESGLAGVTVLVTDPGGNIAGVTGAAGTYVFDVAAGVLRDAIEINPVGWYSLGPDTVSVPAGAAGDTTWVYYADVMGPVLAPNNMTSAPAGGFADFAHTITAGTAGQAVVSAAVPGGWIETFYRDNNGDGLLDPGDTPLAAADLALDPAVPGLDIVPIILHVFIPATVPVGTIETITVTLDQTFSGTAVTATVSALDQVTVLASASGLLQLVKEVDLAAAQPGDVITYTIIFSNPGSEDVREIEIIDPSPAEVDIELGSFGPGQDVAWVNGAVTTYLTADPADADEAMYISATRTLHVLLSRQAPFALAPGEEGRIIYRVRIQ